MMSAQSAEQFKYTLPDSKGGPSGIVITLRPATLLERMRMFDAQYGLEPIAGPAGEAVTINRHFELSLHTAINHIQAVDGIPSETAWPRSGTVAERTEWLDRHFNAVEIQLIGSEVFNRAIMGELEKKSLRG